MPRRTPRSRIAALLVAAACATAGHVHAQGLRTIDDEATVEVAPSARASRDPGSGDRSVETGPDEARRLREQAIVAHVADLARLQRVFGRLARAAAQRGRCAQHTGVPWRADVGMLVLDRPAGPNGEVFERLFGTRERPVVVAVAPGSPAEAAGFRVGDEIAAFVGAALDARELMSRLGDLRGGERIVVTRRPSGAGTNGVALRVASAHDAAPPSVPREASAIDTVTVAAAPACALPVSLTPQRKPLAYVDRERIVISQGMVRAAADDEDLAVVLGHELAHALLGHTRSAPAREEDVPKRMLAAAITSGVRDPALVRQALADDAVRSREFDADALAVRLMLDAGYSVERAASFWWRLAAIAPVADRVGVAGEHPGPALRGAAMQRAIDEARAIEAGP